MAAARAIVPLDRNVDPDVNRDGDGAGRRDRFASGLQEGHSSEQERGLVFGFSKKKKKKKLRLFLGGKDLYK